MPLYATAEDPTLKDEGTTILQNAGNDYTSDTASLPRTHARHFPEHLHPEQNCCGNLRTHKRDQGYYSDQNVSVLFT
jgi:hypothetical protein